MKILIIEDEKELAKSIACYLKAKNYCCILAKDLKTAMDKSDVFDYDLILLDIGLPDGNGLTLLKELKETRQNKGVIIISAKNSMDDRIYGLNLGADDYLTKPFHLSELHARITSVIRRRKFGGQDLLTLNEIQIEVNSKTVRVNNLPLSLTPCEFDLLLYFATNKNHVISKNAIAEHLSGEDLEFFDDVDFTYTHIKNLKKKLSLANSRDYIKSIYGMGYKFEI